MDADDAMEVEKPVEARVDEEVKKKKKHKKKKAKDRGDTSASDTEHSVDSKTRRKKHKKKKKKKKERDTSDTSDGESIAKSKTKDEVNAKETPMKGPGRAKLEPSEWSREELLARLHRFGFFEQDRVTGSSKLRVENKRIYGEDIKVLLEMFRRFTEIQHVTFKECFLSDETFQRLCDDGMRNVRHLITLTLVGNALTGASMTTIITTFSANTRRLRGLDVRENILTVQDGYALMNAFPMLDILNGIPVREIKHSDNIACNCNDLKLRLADIAMLCVLLNQVPQIREVNLCRNYIEPDCLLLMLEHMLNWRSLRKLDLRFNPLTLNGTDNSGVAKLVDFMKRHQMICYLELTGCKVLDAMNESIQRSCAVNRSVFGHHQGKYYEKFLENKIFNHPKAPPPPKPYFEEGWAPSLTLDSSFSGAAEAEIYNGHIVLPKFGKRNLGKHAPTA